MPKMKFQYCLSCGTICVPLGGSHWGEHWVKTGKECYGPFADSTPPQLPENWNELVTEPSNDELEEMDENAENLLFDLELM